MIYAYMRVSTDKQCTDRQQLLIKEYCNKNKIVLDSEFEDIISGKTYNRPQYNKLKESLKSGDTVIIASIDRLGRNWDQNKAEYKWFLENNINLKLCDYPILDIDVNENNKEIDLSNKLIKSMMIDVLCYGAEMERKKISLRTTDSLRAKKERGEILGRPRKHELGKIIELYAGGKDVTEIALELNANSGYVRQELVKAGIYKSKVSEKKEKMFAIIKENYSDRLKPDKEMIKDLKTKGVTSIAIADYFGLARQYIYEIENKK